VASQPRVQYVSTSDGVSVAFCETGEGYPIMYLPGAPWNHVQIEWRLPQFRNWFDSVYADHRFVVLDARGSGMSDRNVSNLTLEGFELDIEAVADKLGLERFALAAAQISAMSAISFAAHNPHRLSHLFLWDAVANGSDFMALPQVKQFFSMLEFGWDTFVSSIARLMVGWDSPDAPRFEEFIREAVTQEDAKHLFFDYVANTDVTPLLPQVTQPTLVTHHRANLIPPLDSSRLVASRIPNAEFLLLDGEWRTNDQNLPVTMDALDRLLGPEAGRRSPRTPLTVPRAPLQPAPELVTILFTDIEGSTALTQRLGDVRARELLREHERITRQALRDYGGSEVKSMGDGFMASFTSATRALECAIAMQRAFAQHNESSDTPLNIRIGLNTGEPIAEEEDLFGTAVITASRIAAAADGGEILVSNVVRELVAGRGFAFADRGEMALRGFDDPVRVFELRWRE
jgi:class 3 adenylate cyclase/pimeloyl-ACP methyl ester carboxylesterase